MAKWLRTPGAGVAGDRISNGSCGSGEEKG